MRVVRTLTGKYRNIYNTGYLTKPFIYRNSDQEMSGESRGTGETFCKKELGKAITKENEEELRKFTVENVLEFLDDQLEWKKAEDLPSKKTRQACSLLNSICNLMRSDPRKRDDIEKKEDPERRDDETNRRQTEERKTESGIHENVDKVVQDDQKKDTDGIQFDYSKLIGKPSYESSRIKLLVDTIPDGKKILKHPVVEAFIMMKWVKLFFFCYLWVTLKLVFLYFFLSYGFCNYSTLGMEYKRFNCSCNVTCEDLKNERVAPIKKILENTSESMTTSDTERWYHLDDSKREYVIYAIWGWFVLFEIIEISKNVQRTWKIKENSTKKYGQLEICIKTIIRSMKRYLYANNLLQFLIYIGLTGPLLFMDLDCWTNRVLYSVLLPIMGIEILFESGYHPFFYQYIYMFYRVIKSYFRILVVYMPIICGFCFSFYQLFPESDEYSIGQGSSGVQKMVGKTFVMLLGEIEYMDIPIEESGWRMLCLLVFLFSMPLVLLNLLNAVAIADITEITKEAEKEVLYNLLILLEILEPIPIPIREVII